jgi:hypothetical protein
MIIKPGAGNLVLLFFLYIKKTGYEVCSMAKGSYSACTMHMLFFLFEEVYSSV